MYPKGSLLLTLKDVDLSPGNVGVCVEAGDAETLNTLAPSLGRASPPDAEDSASCSALPGSSDSVFVSSGVALKDVADVVPVPSLPLEVSLVFDSLLSDGDTRATRSASSVPFGCSNLRRTAGAGRSGRRRKSATAVFRGKTASGLLLRFPVVDGETSMG